MVGKQGPMSLLNQSRWVAQSVGIGVVIHGLISEFTELVVHRHFGATVSWHVEIRYPLPYDKVLSLPQTSPCFYVSAL